MSTIMMALGPYRFAVDSFILDSIDRKLPARHADIELVGRAPGSQFIGPGAERIELPAVLYPAFLQGRGLSQLDGLRESANRGTPLMLAAGTGRTLGLFTVREVSDVRRHNLPNGYPQKVEIRIELVRYTPVGGFSTGGINIPGAIGAIASRLFG